MPGSFRKKLEAADSLYLRESYAACIRECGAIFEKGMRELLHNLLPVIEELQQRRMIEDAENLIGAGKAFGTFHLTQLEGLYRQAGIFDMLRKHVKSPLRKTRRIDWKTMISWRNEAVHECREFSPDEAMQMLIWTRSFLYECGLVPSGHQQDSPPKADQPQKSCAGCSGSIKEEWAYCPGCGMRLSLTCRSCKRILMPDFRICPYCETQVPLCSEQAQQISEKVRSEYAILCRGAWLDGIINARERLLLNQVRLELGLSDAEADDIEQREAPPGVINYLRLVEGALADGVISKEERAFLNRKAASLGIDPADANELEEALKACEEKRGGELVVLG